MELRESWVGQKQVPPSPLLAGKAGDGNWAHVKYKQEVKNRKFLTQK